MGELVRRGLCEDLRALSQAMSIAHPEFTRKHSAGYGRGTSPPQGRKSQRAENIFNHDPPTTTVARETRGDSSDGGAGAPAPPPRHAATLSAPPLRSKAPLVRRRAPPPPAQEQECWRKRQHS